MKIPFRKISIIGGGVLAVAAAAVFVVVTAPSRPADAAGGGVAPVIGIQAAQGSGSGGCTAYLTNVMYSSIYSNDSNPNPTDYAGSSQYDGYPYGNTDCARIWLSGQGPFTSDFQIGVRMQNPKKPGGWGPWGWTPWASDIIKGTASTQWSPWIGGITNIGSDPGHAMYQVAVNTRPLQDPGDTISGITVGLQESDHNDYSGAPYYCDQNISDGFAKVYSDGTANNGWSTGGKGTDGSFSGVGDLADCTRLYLGKGVLMGAIETANNIPATLNPSQQATTGSDGGALSITMKNVGVQQWTSSFASTDTGTPQGTCDYDYSGSGTKDAPASGSADGSSCSVTVTLTSKNYSLIHSPSSFSMTPEAIPITYTGVTKTTTYHASQETTETGTCDFIAYLGTGICSLDGSSCSGSTCSATRTTGPSWTVSYSGGGYSPSIASGASFTFPLSSITAPSTAGSYNETWQMEKDGVPFGEPFVQNIQVGTSGDTLTVNSTNIVTGKPVTGSWAVVGPTGQPFSSDNKTSDTYDNLADGSSYTTSPVSAAGYALSAVREGSLAIAPDDGILHKVFAAADNVLSSVALASSAPSQGPPAIVCDSTEYSYDAVNNIYVCDGGSGTSNTVSFDSSSGNKSATEIIMWYPIAQMNVNPDSVPLDGSGNGQFAVQNAGSPGSELDWTATTTDSWFTVSPLNGVITNSATQGNSTGATQDITVNADPTKLQSGNWTGIVTLQGKTKYCDLSKTADCSLPQKSVTITFSGGTCSGSGCLMPNGPADPSVSITPASSAITLGQSEKLTIASNNADSCTQSGSWSGSVCNGTVTVTPASTGTFTYKVTAVNANGTSTASATVTVTSAPAPQPACSITASPTSIVVPQATTLTYSCQNIAPGSCTLSGGEFSNSPFGDKDYPGGDVLQGSTTDSPATDTTYTVTCYGTGTYSSVTSSAAVTVTVTNPGRSETNP